MPQQRVKMPNSFFWSPPQSKFYFFKRFLFTMNEISKIKHKVINIWRLTSNQDFLQICSPLRKVKVNIVQVMLIFHLHPFLTLAETAWSTTRVKSPRTPLHRLWIHFFTYCALNRVCLLSFPQTTQCHFSKFTIIGNLVFR